VASFCKAVREKLLKPIRKRGWLTMARMETDCDMDFWRFKFGSKIVALLQKCCCSVDFLQEGAFNHLVGAY